MTYYLNLRFCIVCTAMFFGCVKQDTLPQWNNPFDTNRTIRYPPTVTGMVDTIIGLGDSIVLYAVADDIDGTVELFIWQFSNVIKAETTGVGLLGHMFSAIGVDTVFVRAVDNDGIESSADLIKIVVCETKPQYVAPRNQAVIDPGSVILKWHSGFYKDHFAVYFDTVNPPVSIVIDTLHDSSYTFQNIASATNYYWQIVACNSKGKAAKGPVWSFTIDASPLVTPTLSAPLDGVISEHDTITLVWHSVSRAVSYHVQVSADSNLTDVIIQDSNVTGTSKILNSLSKNMTYYWHVRANDTRGASAWSNVWSFTLRGVVDTAALKRPQGMVLIAAKGSSIQLSGSYSAQFTYNFWMDTTEVTQAQYLSIIGKNPANFRTGDLKLPVEGVSWYEAVRYCIVKSEKDSLENCYDTLNGNNWTCDITKNGYRLPTEVEWEYACRAGSSSTYYWGNAISASYCWYSANSSNTTHEVATRQKNGFGLYDMSGNVWEWCNDWYALYSAGAFQDPVGPGSGDQRTLRGGSWNDKNGEYLGSSYRFKSYPSSRANTFGFRCVCRR